MWRKIFQRTHGIIKLCFSAKLLKIIFERIFVLLNCLFFHSFIYLFIYLFIYWHIHLFINSLVIKFSSPILSQLDFLFSSDLSPKIQLTREFFVS